MNESKATRYQRLLRRSRLAEAASAAAALAALAFTPAGPAIVGGAQAVTQALPDAIGDSANFVVFATVAVALVEAAMLPAALYRGLTLIPRFRAAEQSTLEGIFAEHVRGFAILWLATIVAGGLVLVSAVLVDRWWWAIAGPGIAFGSMLATLAVPAVLARLADVRPVSRPSTASRLSDLARRTGIQVADILEWRVEAGTIALVAGIGRRRVVLLSTEIVRDWSDDEIAVVVAHEFGHVARGDLWRTWQLNSVTILVALASADVAVRWGGGRVGDLATLPATAFVGLGVWMAAQPLRHALSRVQEREADAFALRLTGGIEAFRATLRRLGTRHLAEERPSAFTRWLHFSHPSVAERLEAADAFDGEARQGDHGAARRAVSTSGQD